MLLRLLGMLLVVSVPTVSSAQLFARGRIAARYTSRTCATPCCRTATCAAPATVMQPTVVQPTFVQPTVVHSAIVQPTTCVAPATIVQPTSCVQPASYVQPACVPCTRTVERTRTRVMRGACCPAPCVKPTTITAPAVIIETGGAIPTAPAVSEPVSVVPVIEPAIVRQPIEQVIPSTTVTQAASFVQPNHFQPTSFVQPASFVQRTSYTERSTTGFGAVNDALAIVNQRRAARGLYPLSYDPTLAMAAQRKSQNRAYRRMTGHDGSNKAGARAEGVGFAHGGGNLNGRFQTCHLYSTGYRSAGAAVAYDSRGAAYYTLLLR